MLPSLQSGLAFAPLEQGKRSARGRVPYCFPALRTNHASTLREVYLAHKDVFLEQSLLATLLRRARLKLSDNSPQVTILLIY